MSDEATHDIRTVIDWVGVQRVEDLPDHVAQSFLNLRLNLREERKFKVLTHEEAHEEWMTWMDSIVPAKDMTLIEAKGPEDQIPMKVGRGSSSSRSVRASGWRSWLSQCFSGSS